MRITEIEGMRPEEHIAPPQRRDRWKWMVVFVIIPFVPTFFAALMSYQEGLGRMIQVTLFGLAVGLAIAFLAYKTRPVRWRA